MGDDCCQGRCTGHCCRQFPVLQYSELCVDPDRFRDGRFVLDMLLPLPRIALIPMFTCRHLRENGDCGVYADRPQMCRDYPYGKRCTTPGCTAVADPKAEGWQRTDGVWGEP